MNAGSVLTSSLMKPVKLSMTPAPPAMAANSMSTSSFRSTSSWTCHVVSRSLAVAKQMRPYARSLP